MAWEDYFAVINADVYDLEGLLKPILSRIAFLMIGTPNEGEEADPDVGWCVAGQPYIAATVGCSRTAVNRAVKRFIADKWLRGRYELSPLGDTILYLHWTNDAPKRLEALRFKRDGRGKLIRSGHRPHKKNKNSTFQKSSGEKLLGGLPAVEQRVASGQRREVTKLSGETLLNSAARSAEVGGEVPFEGVAVGLAAGLQMDTYMQAQPSAERLKPTATPSKGLRPSETPAQESPAVRLRKSQSEPNLVSPKPREERGHIFEWLSGALSGCNYCSIPFAHFIQTGRPQCRGKQTTPVPGAPPEEESDSREDDLFPMRGNCEHKYRQGKCLWCGSTNPLLASGPVHGHMWDHRKEGDPCTQCGMEQLACFRAGWPKCKGVAA
jgi:hypothetical protein